jgi:hypothetical protein
VVSFFACETHAGKSDNSGVSSGMILRERVFSHITKSLEDTGLLNK